MTSSQSTILSRRSVLGTALLGAAAPFAFSSCSDGKGSGKSSASGTVVRFWTVVEGPDDEKFQRKMFDAFNSQHGDVQVDMQVFPSAQFGNAMQLAFTGKKDAPDVFRVGPGARLDDAVPKGWAAPLDEFLDDDFTSRFPDYCYKDSAHSPLYRDGHAYAVPRP